MYIYSFHNLRSNIGLPKDKKLQLMKNKMIHIL